VPRWRTLSGREVCAIPQAHGFVQVRQRGSHAVTQLSHEGSTVSVPGPRVMLVVEKLARLIHPEVDWEGADRPNERQEG